MRTIVKTLPILVAVAALCLLGKEKWRQHQALAYLNQEAGSVVEERRNPTTHRTSSEWKNLYARNRDFVRVWMGRYDHDVTKEMLVFLRDPDETLRLQSVRALGRLEKPTSVPALMRLQAQVANVHTAAQFDAIKGVPSVPLRLALSRIASRSFHGQKKLDAIAQGVGLQWRDVVFLSNQFYAPNKTKRPVRQVTRQEHQLMMEIINVLYAMRKQGQNITPWTKQLALPQSYKTILQGAQLSPQKEVNYILNYLASLKTLRPESYDILSHVIGLQGIRSGSLAYLKTVKLNPIPAKPRGYKMLFYVAAVSGGKQAIPLIKRFESSRDTYVRGQAEDFRKSLEKGETTIPELP